jgi:hypothetical protein
MFGQLVFDGHFDRGQGVLVALLNLFMGRVVRFALHLFILCLLHRYVTEHSHLLSTLRHWKGEHYLLPLIMNILPACL